MGVLIVLGLSVLLQGLTALLAFRLIRLTTQKKAWSLLGTALLLMASYRALNFFQLLQQPRPAPAGHFIPEFFYLLITLLMLTGVISFFPLLKQRTRKEKDLFESEARFKTLYEALPIGISLFDREGNIVEANKVSEKILGLPPEKLLSRNLSRPEWQILKPDHSPMTAEELPGSVALKENRLVENAEMGVKRPDGSIVWLNVTAAPLHQGRLGGLLVYSDITSLKETEAALRKSQRQYQDLFENSMDLICAHDLSGKLLSINPQASLIMGYETQELIGMNLQDLVVPDYRDLVETYLSEIQKKGKAVGLLTALSKQGERRYWEYNGFLRAEGDDGPLVRGFARDITEQRRAQKALKKSEEKYRMLAETAQDYILALDLQGKVIYANPAALAASGYSAEEASRMKIADILPAETLSRIADGFSKRASGDEGHWVYEVDFLTKSGDRVPVEVDSTLIKEEGRPSGVLIIARDITERRQAEAQQKKMEEQLRHVQKLESLGVLAGGIAHDFNNLLMGILGNADLALTVLTPANPARQNLMEIEKAARRAAELCRQMLAYSGRGKFVVEPLNLTEVVREMAHMLEISISKKAALRYHFEPDLPAVQADATQMRQIIMNLITNASEAMGEENGVIAVSTGVMVCDREYLRSTWLNDPLPPGTYVYLEVSDTGCGMDPETLSKIFDPFFSTKFTGRGLGLAAILGIVRGHQGAIKVYSETGKGSTFRVLLPAVAEVNTLTPRESLKEKEEWKGKGIVLLVDDDETVRIVGTQMLERLGFEVLSAVDGQEALECYGRQADHIRCILLDLTMPRLDGEECFRELRRIREDVKVVVTSGYNEQEVSRRFIGKGLAGFIQKPFSLKTLEETLKGILGTEVAGSREQ
ncbi:MAG: PAS domain S-box protein [Thermodesulfobacteriota bacterium]